MPDQVFSQTPHQSQYREKPLPSLQQRCFQPHTTTYYNQPALWSEEIAQRTHKERDR